MQIPNFARGVAVFLAALMAIGTTVGCTSEHFSAVSSGTTAAATPVTTTGTGINPTGPGGSVAPWNPPGRPGHIVPIQNPGMQIYPGFIQLRGDLVANNITTIEGMLAFFARTPIYASLLTSIVLERQSGALHSEEVSPAFPRVVMGGGNISLHFTANPSLPGHNLVEIIELPDGDDTFHFHLINFALAPSPDMFLDDPILSNPDQANVTRLLDLYSKTTGGTVLACNGCHMSGTGSNPRQDLTQNWNPGLNAFRVYGYKNDRILKDTSEYQDFQLFKKTLQDPVAGSIYKQLPLVFSDDADGNIQFTTHPVRSFNQHVFELARRKMLQLVSEFSLYDQYQYMIAGALMNCDNLEEFLPNDSRREHEFLLREQAHTKESFVLYLAGIGKNEVKPEFWKKFSVNNPEHFQAMEGDVMDYSTLSLMDTLSIEIRENIELLKREDLSKVPDADRADYIALESRFHTPSYIGRLTKLKYIFRAYFPELPAQLYSLINEVTTQPNSNKALFATPSYRVLGADGGLDHLLSQFGEKFLKDNPDMDQFLNHKMIVSALTGTTWQKYCSDLRDASRDAFKENPLDGKAGHGHNGDLCEGKQQICGFPLECNDRGDGVKACTGSDEYVGKKGDLCAGVNAISFCDQRLSCVQGDDKVYRCQ